MSHEKQTLPNEVVNAVNELRALEFTDADILLCAVSSTRPHTPTTLLLYNYAMAGGGLETLIGALADERGVLK